MSGVVMLILVIVYSIAVFVIYHKIFDVYYFNLTSGIGKELFGSFIAGLILTALTLSMWYITAIILVITGLVISQKISNPNGKKACIAAFVIFAIVVTIVGISFKKQVDQKNSLSNSNNSTVISDER